MEENLHIALLAGRNHTQQVPGMVYDLFPFLYAMRQQRDDELTGGLLPGAAHAARLRTDFIAGGAAITFGVHTGDHYCLLEGGRNVTHGRSTNRTMRWIQSYLASEQATMRAFTALTTVSHRR